MRNAALKLDPKDNAPIAFRDLRKRDPISDLNQDCALVADVLEQVAKAANGEVLTKAELIGHNDFIPGKRGISI
jgi:hypothetical protein